MVRRVAIVHLSDPGLRSSRMRSRFDHRRLRLRFTATVTHMLPVVAAAMVGGTQQLSAQTDTGRVDRPRLIGVLDAQTGDWIDRAVVRDTLGDETTTTRFGVATLNVLNAIAGYYLIEVRKEGHAPRRLRLRADTTFEIILPLQPNALGSATQLPAMVTTERRRMYQDAGERRGFLERCRATTAEYCQILDSYVGLLE